MVKIRDGFYYKTRDGRAVGPMRKNSYMGRFLDVRETITGLGWYSNGSFLPGGSESPLDLVEEVKPLIIAVSGLAGSGKSTVADYLVKYHGFKVVKFAAPLKNMLRAIGLTENEIEGDAKELPCDILQGSTPRHAMQTLGTEWGRDSISPDLWLELWKREAVKWPRVVCDDCRFNNEAETIRSVSGFIIGITGRGGINGNHVSENLVKADLVLDNTGTKTELYEKIEKVLDAAV